MWGADGGTKVWRMSEQTAALNYLVIQLKFGLNIKLFCDKILRLMVKNCPLFKTEWKKGSSIYGDVRTSRGKRLSVSLLPSSCLSVCLSVQLVSPSLNIRDF
jgi:hypothetical protein